MCMKYFTTTNNVLQSENITFQLKHCDKNLDFSDKESHIDTMCMSK